MIVVATSGYFNPLHVGHLKLLQEAKKLGDYLVVIVNNDEQVKLKGSAPFMSENERLEIVKALKCVDHAILSTDKDKTVCDTLRMLRPNIFAKGGDSDTRNVPEQGVCKEEGIKIVWGVGGEKIQASSVLINDVLRATRG